MGRLDSAQFRGSYKKTVAVYEKRVSAATGFIKLVGTVWYLPKLKRASVFITGHKTKSNKGPICAKHASVPWPQGGGDFKGMRLHMQALVDKMAAELKARSWPEPAIQIEKCNVQKANISDFMEQTCVGCECWYCELSG